MCNSSSTPDVTGKLTPLGNCVIEVDRENERVKVVMKPSKDVSIRHSVNIIDGNVVLDIWRGLRIPKIGDEVTINGKSGEVTGVVLGHDGSTWVDLDGHRVRYE